MLFTRYTQTENEKYIPCKWKPKTSGSSYTQITWTIKILRQRRILYIDKRINSAKKSHQYISNTRPSRQTQQILLDIKGETDSSRIIVCGISASPLPSMDRLSKQKIYRYSRVEPHYWTRATNKHLQKVRRHFTQQLQSTHSSHLHMEYFLG